MANQPYNPLDKRHLGESVATALLNRPVIALAKLEPFIGAGIYALYYVGGFEPYRRITERNIGEQWAAPIYVGKAVPLGARKGAYGLGEAPGEVLYRRLREHADSISQVENLSIEDFHCRYLVVDDIWIPLGEALLIGTFAPAWNRFLDGFGNHDPGKGRYNQQRSPWDEIHPGRAWAAKLQPNLRSRDEILHRLSQFIE